MATKGKRTAGRTAESIDRQRDNKESSRRRASPYFVAGVASAAGATLTAGAVLVALYVGTDWFLPSFGVVVSILTPIYLQVFRDRREDQDEMDLLERRTSSVRELKEAFDKELEELRRTSRSINVSATSGGVVNMSDLTPLTNALAIEESRVLADDFRRLSERERRAAFLHRLLAAAVIAIGGALVYRSLSEASEFSALLITRKLTIGIPTAVLFAWLQRLAHEHFMISDWASRVAVQLAPIGSVTLLLADQSDRNAVIRTFLTNVFVGAAQPSTRSRSKAGLTAGLAGPLGSGRVDVSQDYSATSSKSLGSNPQSGLGVSND